MKAHTPIFNTDIMVMKDLQRTQGLFCMMLTVMEKRSDTSRSQVARNSQRQNFITDRLRV
jgi:hypothetical protein